MIKMTEMENENSVKRSKSYLIYLLIILMLVQILDTYVTFSLNVVQSKIIEEFLSDYPFNTAVSILAMCLAISTLGLYFVFLNQYIADRVGRKKLMAISVFGMGLMSLLLTFSTNIFEYTFYLFLLNLFYGADIWVIYINEESPKDKRASWTSYVLLGGLVGSFLIPVFRSIYITDTSPATAWRGMTYFSILLGIPLGIVIVLTIKETSKYQEIKRDKSLKLETTKEFKTKLKTLFHPSRRKVIIVLLTMAFIRALSFIFLILGEAYLSGSPYLNEHDINIIVLAMSITIALGYLITGILADKIGRKPLMYLYSILLPISLIIIVIGRNSSQNALIIVCIGAGLADISFFGMAVLVTIVTIENLPTEVRGTGNGLKTLFNAIGMTIGLILTSIIILRWGFEVILIIFGLLNLIFVPLIYKYIKETKGVDLSIIK